VSRTRAVELNLKIADKNPELESLMWQAYLGLESYLQLRTPFDPLQEYLADPAGAASLTPAAPIVLPANTPPALAQQVWQAAANNALQNPSPAAQVQYSTRNAVIESVRVASEHRTEGRISASTMPNGEIRVSVVNSYARWGVVQEPNGPASLNASGTPS